MFVYLSPEKIIAPIREISDVRVMYWKYGKEYPLVGAALAPGTKLKVVELNKAMGNMWVKVEIPGSDPHRYLKITSEEFSNNFKMIN